VRFVGGEVPDAVAATQRMYEITLARMFEDALHALAEAV
jgi:hypothetical protein